jgi:hypothetical protein
VSWTYVLGMRDTAKAILVANILSYTPGILLLHILNGGMALATSHTLDWDAADDRTNHARRSQAAVA